MVPTFIRQRFQFRAGRVGNSPSPSGSLWHDRAPAGRDDASDYIAVLVEVDVLRLHRGEKLRRHIVLQQPVAISLSPAVEAGATLRRPGRRCCAERAEAQPQTRGASPM